MPGPPMVVANAVQVRLRWLVQTETAFNVLNFRATSAVVVNQALADQVGTQVKLAFAAQWAAHTATGNSLQKVGIRDLRVASSAEFVDSGSASAGGAAADSLPPQNAVVVTLRTAKAGRSFRGRVYLPGLSELDNSPTGVTSTAANTAAAAFINDIATRLQPIGLTFAVLSRPSDASTTTKTTTHSDGTTTVKNLSVVTAKAGEINDVTLVQVRNNRTETQRRRNNARGAGIASTFSPLVSVPIGTV
jgi:hypothetical protein